jgi:hypothetical protein
MNGTTSNETNFLIPLSESSHGYLGIVHYVISGVIFILIALVVHFFLKICFKTLLKRFNHEETSEGKFCCCDVFGLRFQSKEQIIKKKRMIYKTLWVTSFSINSIFEIILIGWYIIHWEISFSYAIALIGTLAFIFVICCNLLFVSYFKGLLCILTDELMYYKDYNLLSNGTKEKNIMYKNVKFLGVSFRKIKWYDNEENISFKMNTSKIDFYEIQDLSNDNKIKSDFV